MLVKILFDVVIVGLVILIFKRINVGLYLVFFAKILIPYYVSFSIGSIEFAMYDIISLAILCSLLLHIQTRRKMPYNVAVVLWLPLVSGLLLIFLSSGYVPYDYQLKSLVKNIFLGEIVFLFAFYYCATKFNLSVFFKHFLIICIVCGIYGIVAYAMGVNPYITMLSYTYTGAEFAFAYFLDEVRGFLLGRASGTFTHPLIWGKFWTMAIAFLLCVRKNLNVYLLYLGITIGIVNVVLCGSRTAAIAMLVFLAFYCLSLGKRKIILFSSILLIICFSVAMLPENLDLIGQDKILYAKSIVFFWDDSYSMQLGINGSNAAMRQSQMDAVSNLVFLSPIAGLGFNYQYYVLENSSVFIAALRGMESVVIKKLVEQGICGLICFVFVLWSLYRETVTKIHSRTDFLCFTGFFVAFIASACMSGIQGGNWVLFVSLVFVLLHHYKGIGS